MSIACKCERCGKLYEPKQDDEACVPNQPSSITFNTITLNHKNYMTDSFACVGFSRMDICPTCARSFTMWWINPEITNNIMITSNGDVKTVLL